jgi:hypothetical protein
MNQLIAFALIRDRGTQALAAFLGWVKSHLPAAFVVDRHDGQLAALRLVFPKSRIVFYSKHVGENVKRAMGNRHELLKRSGICYTESGVGQSPGEA